MWDFHELCLDLLDEEHGPCPPNVRPGPCVYALLRDLQGELPKLCAMAAELDVKRGVLLFAYLEWCNGKMLVGWAGLGPRN